MTRVSLARFGSNYKKNSLRTCIPNQLPFCYSSRRSSSFSQLKEDMTTRSLPILWDHCSFLNSYLLSNTLEDFLPPALERISYVYYSDGISIRMPFAHHLVYFPPTLPLSSLYHDGTDPLHSPGPPFTRRMWAGGKIDYSASTLWLNDLPAFCLERITDLTIRGQEGHEKAVVRIERRAHHDSGEDEPEHPEGPFGRKKEVTSPYFDRIEAQAPFEVRNLIFLRDGLIKTASDKMHTPLKVIKPREVPDFSHTLIPSAALLFRFSALTFNAHAIHLDKHYCQEIEGHRNLLVHGPLTVILMVEHLRRYLDNEYVRSGKLANLEERIKSIEYRNLAPLYAEEEMKVCGRKKMNGEYEMWVEGKEGGLAVRGIVRTTGEE